MIKINLATRKQSASVGSGNAQMSRVAGMKLDARLDGLKELPWRKAGAVVLLYVVASYGLEDYKTEELGKVEAVIQTHAAEQTRLKAELAKTRDFDELKKSLDADELSLRTKIDTIQQLIRDRQTPPKMLLSLSGSTPKDVWLTDFQAKEDEITLKGFSLGYNGISDFMKALNESVYFGDLKLVNTAQGRDETGLEAATFDLIAKRKSVQ